MDKDTFTRQYETAGYVILKQFFPPNLVLGMEQAVDRIVDMLAEPLPERHEDEAFETRFIKIYENTPENAPVQFTSELHRDAFYDLMFYPPLVDLAETILGDEIRLAPGYFIRPKAFPDDRFRSLWHQDAAYLYLGNQGYPWEAFDQIRTMNVWTPLVSVNRKNGCMQFLPGTHTNGMALHKSNPPHHYLEIDPVLLEPILQKIQPVEIMLNPGDVVLFNTLMFHRGQDNYSGRVRWSIDFRYQDARQPTLIDLKGHLLRSRAFPERTVQSREHWRSLTIV